MTAKREHSLRFNAKHESFEWGSEQRNKLMQIIGSHEKAHLFIDYLESNVSYATTLRIHSEECTKSKIKGKLKKVKTKAEKLLRELMELDDESKTLLGVPEGLCEKWEEADVLKGLIQQAERALEGVEAFGDGRTLNAAQRYLATSVAESVRRCLGVELKASHHPDAGALDEGVFIKCLRVVLLAAGLSYPNDMYPLARYAIEQEKEWQKREGLELNYEVRGF
jgi:hypothetical protein